MALIKTLARLQDRGLSDAVKRRLVEKGWLDSGKDGGKTRFTVLSPVPLEGTRRRTLRVRVDHIWPPEPSEPLDE
jgi:hypothetical protein